MRAGALTTRRLLLGDPAPSQTDQSEGLGAVAKISALVS